MKKTKAITSVNPIAVPLPELQSLLCLGRPSCERIGKEANAIIRVGKRKLYNVEKIRAYLNSISE